MIRKQEVSLQNTGAPAFERDPLSAKENHVIWHYYTYPDYNTQIDYHKVLANSFKLSHYLTFWLEGSEVFL